MKSILAASLIAVAALTGCGVNTPSSGQKVGQIVRVEEKGIFFKTWEAQLIRGGLSGGSGTMGAAFDFTIERKEDAIKAQVCMEKQTEVILRYRTEGIYAAIRSESGGDFLEQIEPASSAR